MDGTRTHMLWTSAAQIVYRPCCPSFLREKVNGGCGSDGGGNLLRTHHLNKLTIFLLLLCRAIIGIVVGGFPC